MIRSLWDTARASPFPTVAQCEPATPSTSQQPQQQLVHGRNIAAFSTAGMSGSLLRAGVYNTYTDIGT